LISTCASLVSFDRNSQTVRLAHHTVRNFLLGKWESSVTGIQIAGEHETKVPEPQLTPTNNKLFHFTLGNAERNIAEICITYLYFVDFETQLVKIETHNPPKLSASTNTVNTAIWHQIPLASRIARLVSLIYGFDTELSAGNPIMLNIPILIAKNTPSGVGEKHRLLNYIIFYWPGTLA
jgi:hypothetical protein